MTFSYKKKWVRNGHFHRKFNKIREIHCDCVFRCLPTKKALIWLANIESRRLFPNIGCVGLWTYQLMNFKEKWRSVVNVIGSVNLCVMSKSRYCNTKVNVFHFINSKFFYSIFPNANDYVKCMKSNFALRMDVNSAVRQFTASSMKIQILRWDSSAMVHGRSSHISIIKTVLYRGVNSHE